MDPDAVVTALLAKSEQLRQELLAKVEANLSGGLLQERSGALKASIFAEVDADAGAIAFSVGSEGVPYAAIQEYGGTTAPHDIVPVKAQALAFAGAAGPTFARRVHHPGSRLPARAYLGGALDAMQDEIAGGLKAAVLEALGAALTGDIVMSIRETAIAALAARVASAYAWAAPPSRRLKLWSDVPPAMRPACFLFEGGTETYANAADPASKRSLLVRLFIYVDAHDPAALGAAQLNAIMDALDAALAPAGADITLGRTTLSGAVHRASIDGKPLKDPGDLDGDGLLVVPIALVLP